MTLPAEVAALIGRGEIARRVADLVAAEPGLSQKAIAERLGLTVRSVTCKVFDMNISLAGSGWRFVGNRHKGQRLVFEGVPEPEPQKRRLTCIPPDMRPKRRRLTATPPKGWKPNPVPAGNPGSSNPQLGRGLSAAPAFSGGQK